MLKIVLDTNVLVSAAMHPRKSRMLLELGLAERFVIVTSDLLLEEFAGVTSRPKFAEGAQVAKEFASAINSSCKKINMKSSLRVIRDDPNDDIMVNTAIDGKADYIVTGDSHLMELRKFKWIRIVTVDEMLKKLGH